MISIKAIKIITTIVLGAGMCAIVASAVMTSVPRQLVPTDYKIVQTWYLPTQLEEISGMAWIGGASMACVQDEDGIIFIYDLEQKKITDQIPFADPADFEGIAVHDGDAYVMSSDGKIFEVARFRESENKAISSFQTDFNGKDNMETLALSADGKSLLTMPKDGKKNDDFRGIYRINMENQNVDKTPFIKIRMKDKALQKFLKDKQVLSPSDMAVHPSTKDYYVLEGVRPKVVVLSPDGKIKKVIQLAVRDFPQPESITFNDEGRLFIANEADTGTANILEVELDLD